MIWRHFKFRDGSVVEGDGRGNTSLWCHRRCCAQSVYMLGFDLLLLLTRTTLCGNFTSNWSSKLYIVADDHGETNNVLYTQFFKYIFLMNSMKSYGMLSYFHTSRISYQTGYPTTKLHPVESSVLSFTVPPEGGTRPHAVDAFHCT